MAARLIRFVLDFRTSVAQGTLAPDGKLDMSQYLWMFDACRVPVEGVDHAVKVAEDDPAGAFVLLIRRDHLFKLPVFHSDGRELTAAELAKGVQDVWEAPLSQGVPLGVLTGINRDDWARSYAQLRSSSEVNNRSLDDIERAAFVLALEEGEPGGREEFSRQLWHGTGHNRWWDKPMQWVLYGNGWCGFIGEHSCMDGSPVSLPLRREKA